MSLESKADLLLIKNIQNQINEGLLSNKNNLNIKTIMNSFQNKISNLENNYQNFQNNELIKTITKKNFSNSGFLNKTKNFKHYLSKNNYSFDDSIYPILTLQNLFSSLNIQGYSKTIMKENKTSKETKNNLSISFYPININNEPKPSDFNNRNEVILKHKTNQLQKDLNLGSSGYFSKTFKNKIGFDMTKINYSCANNLNRNYKEEEINYSLKEISKLKNNNRCPPDYTTICNKNSNCFITTNSHSKDKSNNILKTMNHNIKVINKETLKVNIHKNNHNKVAKFHSDKKNYFGNYLLRKENSSKIFNVEKFNEKIKNVNLSNDFDLFNKKCNDKNSFSIKNLNSKTLNNSNISFNNLYKENPIKFSQSKEKQEFEQCQENEYFKENYSSQINLELSNKKNLSYKNLISKENQNNKINKKTTEIQNKKKGINLNDQRRNNKKNFIKFNDFQGLSSNDKFIIKSDCSGSSSEGSLESLKSNINKNHEVNDIKKEDREEIIQEKQKIKLRKNLNLFNKTNKTNFILQNQFSKNEKINSYVDAKQKNYKILFTNSTQNNTNFTNINISKKINESHTKQNFSLKNIYYNSCTNKVSQNSEKKFDTKKLKILIINKDIDEIKVNNQIDLNKHENKIKVISSEKSTKSKNFNENKAISLPDYISKNSKENKDHLMNTKCNFVNKEKSNGVLSPDFKTSKNKNDSKLKDELKKENKKSWAGLEKINDSSEDVNKNSEKINNRIKNNDPGKASFFEVQKFIKQKSENKIIINSLQNNDNLKKSNEINKFSFIKTFDKIRLRQGNIKFSNF